MKKIILFSLMLFCSASHAGSSVQIDCGSSANSHDARFIETRLLVTSTGYSLSSYGHPINYLDMKKTRDGYLLQSANHGANEVVLKFSSCRNGKATLTIKSESPQACACKNF